MALELIISTVCNLLFPQFCGGCKIKISKGHFCTQCLGQLEILPIARQDYFGVFENFGTAKIFANSLKKYPSLNKTAAAYLFLQLSKLNWNNIEAIACDPQNIVLAKALRKYLKIPLDPKDGKYKNVLYIDTVISKEKYFKLKQQKQGCRLFALGLCFDVALDHLNLPA